MISIRKGFSEVIIVLVLGIVVLVAFFLYYLLTTSKSIPSLGNPIVGKPQEQNLSPTMEPVSESSDLETLKREIDTTDVGSIEEDIDLLEQEASSL